MAMNMHPSLLSALEEDDKHSLHALLKDYPTLLSRKTVKGNHILHIAASLGNVRLITLACNQRNTGDLLQNQNAKGDTVLHCAARAGQDHILSLLIGHHDWDWLKHVVNHRGDTALHEAVRGGHVSAVRKLVAAADDMAAVINVDGETPLYLAAERGSVEAVLLLLRCLTVEYGGPRGQTALHAAVCRSYDIVEMLLRKKPELNQVMDASQSAPIHYAASLGDVKMVRLLLEANAAVAHILDDHGLSAIHIAASKNYANVIEEILYYCFDAIELTDNEGNTFLHIAAKKGSTEVVKLVLNNPLLIQSINETDHEGNTSLHLAIMNHNREIVNLLLEDSRVDKNVINRKGLTPLDIVASYTNSSLRLRMNKMLEEFTSAGSKFGIHRMDIVMGKDQRRPDDELNRYRTMANNLAIMAVLIASVTFAAAFTLPGGYINDGVSPKQGMSILAKKVAFKVFLISDTIAMLSSICITCLLISTGSLDHDIRLHSIITAMKFMWVALGGTVVAFSMGIYVVVESKCRWLAVLICGMTVCIPLIAWMIACWPTLGFIKLQKARNQKTARHRKNLQLPRFMLVEFDTPHPLRNDEEPPVNSSDIAETLLRKKPELNQQTDASQSAPIHYAASLGDVKMVRLLLEANPAVAHLLDNHGLSAIHIAASKNHANVIEEILYHSFDAIELTDNEGNNFLHSAAKKGSATVMKLVLNNPLLIHNINETDHEGNTPLHLAVTNHRREIVNILLSDSRVDKNVINRKGLTPLDIVSSHTNSSIRLRMKKMLEECTSAGSKFGIHRMDVVMGKDQRRQDDELTRYRTMANNLAIMAVLIASVTFTAGFSLPGSYINDGVSPNQGTSILAKKVAFKAFLISDTIAMLSSICITCLLISTSSLDHDIRLHAIITAMKFMWVALGGTMVAFSMGIYVVVEPKCRWLAILICGMAAYIPFVAWMVACWPTLGFIKLPKARNRKTDRDQKTLQLPRFMSVEFDTPHPLRNNHEPPV